jgi:hypothetical protein
LRRVADHRGERVLRVDEPDLHHAGVARVFRVPAQPLVEPRLCMAAGGGAMPRSSLREVLVEELGIRRRISSRGRRARRRWWIRPKRIRRSARLGRPARSRSARFTEDESGEHERMSHAVATMRARSGSPADRREPSVTGVVVRA